MKFDYISFQIALELMYEKSNVDLISFQIALELMYEKSNVDLITGLRTKTEAGRPDFDKVRADNEMTVCKLK